MADKIVEVPGIGNVSFPDSMPDDQIALQVRKQLASQGKPAAADKGWFNSTVDAISNFFGGANDTANPVSGKALQANAQIVQHPVDSAKTMLGQQGALATAAKDSFGKGDYLTGVRHAISYLIPVLGPAIDEAGNKAANGQVARGLGEAAGIAVPMALGARPKAPEVPIVTGDTVVSPTAVNQYRKALGLKRNTPRTEAQAMAETGVREGLPITEEGSHKLQGLVDNLNQRTTEAVQQAAAAGKTITRDRAVADAGPAIESFETINPTASQKGGVDVLKKFVNDHPDNEIPVDVAQKRKIATYQEVEQERGQKAFGERGDSAHEMKKAIAHSFMTQLEEVIPEVAEFNSQNASLQKFKKPFEAALDKAVNGSGTSFRDLAIAEVGSHTIGMPGAGLAVGVLARVMRDPGFRSRLALAINEAQKAKPAQFGKPNVGTALAKANAYADKIAAFADKSAANTLSAGDAGPTQP